MARWTVFALLVPCLSSGADLPTVASNLQLAQLFREDQDDRRGFPDTKLSYAEINRRGEARRTEVIAMLRRTELRTADDYFWASVIFHHGQTFEHYRMATSLAWIAHEIEPDNTTYQWQTASSWDRMMLKRERPQWYGVQSQRGKDGRSMLSPLDETAVTDEERARYNVKSLRELRLNPGSSAVASLP
jgi:hypothetical protein